MRQGRLLAALAVLGAVAGLAAELARPPSPATAQAPSSADPVQIVRIHNGVYLYWHEPASGGGITGYDVQHRSGISGSWGAWTGVSFSGTTQPAVVTGLTAGTTYQFRVRARTRGARGPGPRRPAPTTTPPASRPSPPPSIAAGAASYTITGLANGRAHDIWMRAHAGGRTSRDSMAVYDVTPRAAAPPPTATSTAAPGPRVLGAVAPHGGGAVTVAPGGTVRLDLDLVDETGGALTVAALPRAPVIGWYLPVDAHAHRRQYEARVAVVFEETFPDRRPRAPLASVAGEPGSVLYSAPAGASGEVVVRAVTAAADCPGGGGGTDRYAAAAWDGPCSAEFTITVVPAVSIAAVSPAVGEGSAAQFTVSRTGGTASALTVAVSVSETGSTFSGPPPASVAIAAGASATALDVATVDDEVREDDSVVTATLEAGGGYTVGAAASAAVTVQDDDPLPTATINYDTYDTTGAVTAPGSYAFLTDTGSVTTYEQLRTESSTLRLNTTDANGASRSAFYRGVEPGDRFELREDSDCWTRYHVTEARTQTGAYREFAVRPYAYAYEGCSGAIAARAAGAYTWSPSPPSKPDFTTLIRFGPWILDPGGWPGGRIPNPIPEPSAPGGRTIGGWHNYSGNDPVGDLEAAKRHPLWSEPDLPDDWRLYSVLTGIEGQYAYCASYTPPEGGYGVTVCIGYLDELPVHSGVSTTVDPDPVGKTLYELRIVDGHPAKLIYSPPGTPYAASPYVHIYDVETGIRYGAIAYDAALTRQGAEGVLAIARSLYLE